MGVIEKIFASPLYEILFGTGGVLAIVIAVVSILVQRQRRNKNQHQSGIYVEKSDGTTIEKNIIGKDQAIKVEKSKGTDISGNKAR